MSCATCHGLGVDPAARGQPCLECGGCGITSCCEGACGGPLEVVNGELPDMKVAIQGEIARMFGPAR